jgi:hypothetical protein
MRTDSDDADSDDEDDGKLRTFCTPYSWLWLYSWLCIPSTEEVDRRPKKRRRIDDEQREHAFPTLTAGSSRYLKTKLQDGMYR